MKGERTDKLLKTAIRNKNLEKVKALLSAGADINIVTRTYQSSPLHLATTVDIVRELLQCGANINAKNVFGWTPLYSAVRLKKGIPIVKELLKHNANVNETDFNGFTPLFYNVYNLYDRELDIINELLHYGADINIVPSDYHYGSVLDIAIEKSNIICAKQLIRRTLLRNAHNDYKKVIRLDTCVGIVLRKLSRYLEECLQEVIQMKTIKLSNGHTLFQFVIQTGNIVEPLYGSDLEEISDKFPVYRDIFVPRLKLCLKRGELFNQAKGLVISSSPTESSSSDDKSIIVTLNDYCVYNIALYLSNEDLVNLIQASETNKKSEPSFEIKDGKYSSKGGLGVIVEFNTKRQKTVLNNSLKNNS